jgi:putative membrane protein
VKPVNTMTIAVALALAAAACSKSDAGNDISINASRGEDAAVSDVLGMNQAGVEAPATPLDATSFANAVAASDLFEIESARLVSSKAGSAEIKSFALQLLSDHLKSGMELKAAAAKASPPLTVTTALGAEQQRLLNELKATAGADFDRRFIDQQTNAHQKALGLLMDYVGHGESQPLKDFASRAIPVVEGHLDRLNSIRK